MKKWLVLLMVIAAMSAGNAFAHDGVDHSKEAMHADAEVMYHCPMHPEVTQDKPGKCPKCGMDLVKMDSKEEANHSH